MNDIFGARMILSAEEIAGIMELLDGWQDEFGLKNWYFRDKPEYRGLHVYFKNNSNFFFPWELQLWDKNDVPKNIRFLLGGRGAFGGRASGRRAGACCRRRAARICCACRTAAARLFVLSFIHGFANIL